MGRGISELECINYIRRELFNDGIAGKSFAEFGKDRLSYCRRQMEMMYAMTQEDIEEVEDAFFSCEPNSFPSEFPDFICQDGFIEHFQITSSDITKAGAMYKKERSIHEKLFQQDVDQLKRSLSDEPAFGEIRCVERSFNFTGGHSHENLINSLKIGLNHHIESSLKYGKDCKTKIFVIEYSEDALKMQIMYPDTKPERAYGDLLRREDNRDYRLSRDIEALGYIYSQSKNVDYVVFVTDMRIEIIKAIDSPEIIKLLPYRYYISSYLKFDVDCVFATSIPAGNDE